MSMFDGLTEALQSVPPSNLSFTYDELSVILFALHDYLERLKNDIDNPDLPIFSGYNNIDFDVLTQNIINKFISYSFK